MKFGNIDEIDEIKKSMFWIWMNKYTYDVLILRLSF